MYESEKNYDLKIVAINDLGDANINAHLLKYDTVHGRFSKNVEVEGDSIYVDGDEIKVSSQRDPAQLAWAELNVDVVMECTGFFTSKEAASAHIKAGAKKVIISQPGKDVDATIVYGVNEDTITSDMTVISNASCTTNCLAPFAKVLNDEFGIESGLMNTIHSYTNDQRLSDVYHSDLRRARAAAMSMIPTKTGAAAAVGLVVPELAGKVDGLAVRVPTINVSLVDLTFIVKQEVTVDQINDAVRKAVAKGGSLAEVLSVNDEPLVSIDFNHIPYSSNFDATETRVTGRLVKVMSWYDNEWGFSNRMLDNAVQLMAAK